MVAHVTPTLENSTVHSWEKEGAKGKSHLSIIMKIGGPRRPPENTSRAFQGSPGHSLRTTLLETLSPICIRMFMAALLKVLKNWKLSKYASVRQCIIKTYSIFKQQNSTQQWKWKNYKDTQQIINNVGRKRRNTKAYIQCDSISIRLKRRPNQAVLFRATDLGGAQKSGWWSPVRERGLWSKGGTWRPTGVSSTFCFSTCLVRTEIFTLYLLKASLTFLYPCHISH